MPALPQVQVPSRFPFFTRRNAPATERGLRLRRGASFAPRMLQDGQYPWLLVPSGRRSQLLPPGAVIAGRTAAPYFRQGPQGQQFPLFTRRAGALRFQPPARLLRGHFSVVPYGGVPLPAALRMSASGGFALSPAARKSAEISWSGTGDFAAEATRDQPVNGLWSARGGWRLLAWRTVRPGASWEASGAFQARAARSVSAVLSWSGTGSASILAGDSSGARWSGTGTLAMGASARSGAAVSWSAAGTMTVAAADSAAQRMAVIPPSAVSPPAQVQDERERTEPGEPWEPSQVVIPGITDGQFDPE